MLQIEQDPRIVAPVIAAPTRRRAVSPGDALPLFSLPDAGGRLVPVAPSGPAVVVLAGRDLRAAADLAPVLHRHAMPLVAVVPPDGVPAPAPVPAGLTVLHDHHGDLARVLDEDLGHGPSTVLVVDADRVVVEVERAGSRRVVLAAVGRLAAADDAGATGARPDDAAVIGRAGARRRCR